jgi:tetratricopeptide (TPR) repeat protein
MMFLVPAVVLGALEFALRLAGYGYSTHLFKRQRIGNELFLVENTDFSLRFFPPEIARTPGPIKIKPEKPPGIYRIFILGESAAMGDPEPGFGAARYLEALLRERFPEANFEIVNVAFTAINSHVIVPIARDCAARQGDLWIIYMGNNEMVGPFGAATIFGAKAPPVALVRLGLALQRSRVGQLMAAVAGRLKSKASAPASWGGMQMFLGNQVAPDSPRKEAVYRNFRQNLRDILRAGLDSGARVVLSTVAVNLKDSPPFASFSSTNLPATDRSRYEALFADGLAGETRGAWAEAAQPFEEASRLSPLSAEVHFHWANCLLNMTNTIAARQHFQAACDLDTLPFRTDSRINSLIADAAQQAAHPSLILFDASGWLATNCPTGIPGQESFYEHVHFNFDGNYRLGLGWAEQVARGLPTALTRHAAASWASQDICERRLGLTDWNRCIVADNVLHRYQQPPLSGQSNNGSRMQALQSKITEWHSRMDSAAAAKARELYLEAIGRAPDDYCLHENFASFLAATGDLPGAAAQWQRVHEIIPQDYLANFRLGELLPQLGQLSEAQARLFEAIASHPYLSDPWVELGKIHIAEGKYELALNNLGRAQQLRPSDPECAYHSGRALALLSRRAEAIAQFRQAIRLNPDYWQAHDALGGLLGLDGRVSEAKAEFVQVLRLQPGYGHAHLNLGVALLKEGQASAAAQEFQEALRLEPTNAVARDYLRQAGVAGSKP